MMHVNRSQNQDRRSSVLCVVSSDGQRGIPLPTIPKEVWQACSYLQLNTSFFHIMRAHLQTVLAKSADQQAPPELDITHFGWEIQYGILAPTTSDQPPGPRDLMDVVVRCGCKAEGSTYGTEYRSCRHVKVSCTVPAAMNF